MLCFTTSVKLIYFQKIEKRTSFTTESVHKTGISKWLKMSSSIEFSEAEELDCDEERDSFLHPTFTLRKRRKKDDDTISINSLDQEQELPKRKKSLNKMASLSNVSAALSKVGKRCSALQKSISSSRFGSPVGMRAPSTASLARSASNVFGDTTISGRQSPGSQSLQVKVSDNKCHCQVPFLTFLRF